MTVEVKKDKAPWPLSAYIGMIVTILIASAGFTMYAVQRGADADHRLFAQEINQLAHEQTEQNQIIMANTDNISDLKVDIAILRTQTATILNILKAAQ